MSKLTRFYLRQGPDSAGRMLDDYWSFDNEAMEIEHDYIQWMFPLDESSRFNPDAPLISEDDRKLWRTNPELQRHLHTSFERWLSFQGLELARTEAGLVVRQGFNWNVRKAWWIRPDGLGMGNHNWLRITRVLKCLRLLGLEEHARAYFACLKETYDLEGMISPRSMQFWAEAMT